MALVTITEASKLTDKARKTLYAHINKGKLSCATQEDGSKLIDTAELIRVYGDIKQEVTEVTPQSLPEVTPSNVTFSDEQMAVMSNVIAEAVSKAVEPLKDEITKLTNILEHKPLAEVTTSNTVDVTKSEPPKFLKPKPAPKNYLDDIPAFGKSSH